MSIAAAGAIYGLDRIGGNAMRNAQSLHDFTVQTGESHEALERWAETLNVIDPATSIDQAKDSIKGFINAVSDAKATGANAGVFSMLGLDIDGQNWEQILAQLREKLPTDIKDMGKTRTLGLMGQLNLVPGFMNTLNETSKPDFDKIYNSRPFETDAQIASLDKLGQVLGESKAGP